MRSLSFLLLPVMFAVMPAPVLAQNADVKILSTRLVPWTLRTRGKTGQKEKAAQMLLMNLKNTGTKPIYQIKFDLLLFDSQGKRLEPGATAFTFYAKHKPLQPGRTFRGTIRGSVGKGFIISPPQGKAKRVEVRILSVDHTKPK